MPPRGTPPPGPARLHPEGARRSAVDRDHRGGLGPRRGVDLSNRLRTQVARPDDVQGDGAVAGSSLRARRRRVLRLDGYPLDLPGITAEMRCVNMGGSFGAEFGVEVVAVRCDLL